MTASCSRAVNCDNLWRPWYIILVTSLQAFMLCTGIARYLSFKEDFFDPKYGGNWNSGPMNFYLAMLITATFSVCLFLYASLSRGPNLAGEGVILGKDFVLNHPGSFVWPQQSQSQQEGSNAGLYATANGVLGRGNLSAGLGAVGEEERVAPFDTWSGRSATHVPPSDFVAYPGLPSMFRSMMSTGELNLTGEKEHWSSVNVLWRRLQRRFIPLSSLLHIISAYAFFLALPVLEAQLIFHHALPFGNVWKSNLNPLLHSSPSDAMAVEFFNLLFAFAALALRYPAVFWQTNHAFAFTFSLLLVILGAHGLLEINAAEVIVKLCWNDKNLARSLAGLCQMTPGEESKAGDTGVLLESTVFEKPADDVEGLQNATVLFLSTFGTLTMLFLTSCVFDYGIDQFVDKIVALRRSAIFGAAGQDVAPSDTTSIQAGVGGVCGIKSEGKQSRRRTVVWRRLVAVLGAVCVLTAKMPILIACGRAFEATRRPLLLANIVATVLFFCVWFITWFAFCLKPEWKFKLTYSPLFQPPTTLPVNMTSQYLSPSAILARLEGSGGGPPGTLMAAVAGPGSQRLPQDGMGGVNGAVGGGGGGGGAVAGDNGGSLRLTSGSPPLYTCFHDGAPSAGLCRLAGMAPQPMGHTARAGAGAATQQNTDCCSVDTEGSSRQSGTNNYVCLQSSLNTGNNLGLNTMTQSQSFGNGVQVNPSSFDRQASRSASHDPNEPLSLLRYTLRPNEVVPPTNIRFLNSASFSAQGSGEADAGHLLNESGQESHHFHPHSSTSTVANVGGTISTVSNSKPDDSKQPQPRVTFKELTETMKNSSNTIEAGSSSNPNSSSDSGIDNHGLPVTTTISTTLSSSLFATLPSMSRTSLNLSFNGSGKGGKCEPTYSNHEQMSSSATSTPGVFECPSMPPLNLPQNEAGEVSFASLSRRFNLQTTSFRPPSPLPLSAEALTAREEPSISRSTVIRREERTATGRLCSQV